MTLDLLLKNVKREAGLPSKIFTHVHVLLYVEKRGRVTKFNLPAVHELYRMFCVGEKASSYVKLCDKKAAMTDKLLELTLSPEIFPERFSLSHSTLGANLQKD